MAWKERMRQVAPRGKPQPNTFVGAALVPAQTEASIKLMNWFRTAVNARFVPGWFAWSEDSAAAQWKGNRANESFCRESGLARGRAEGRMHEEGDNGQRAADDEPPTSRGLLHEDT